MAGKASAVDETIPTAYLTISGERYQVVLGGCAVAQFYTEAQALDYFKRHWPKIPATIFNPETGAFDPV